MKPMGSIVAAAILAIAPAPAQATEWWWVSGEPGDRTASFIDADSVRLDKGVATLRLQRILHPGRSIDSVQRVRCDTRALSPDREAIRRFACAGPDERMKIALMLGGIAPREAAQAIFAAPPAAVFAVPAAGIEPATP